MRKKLLKLCLFTVLFVFALCSFTACKKVKSARAVFAPYYTAHTPSASEQKDAILLSNDPQPAQDEEEDSEIAPRFCYAIYRPSLDLSATDAQISAYLQGQIDATSTLYNEDAALNLDYSLDIFAEKLGQLKFFGFSCPLSNQQPGEHQIRKAFFYNAIDDTMLSFTDLFISEQTNLLYQSIDEAVYAQAQLEAASSNLSSDTLLYCLSFEEQGMQMCFPAGTFGQTQSEELKIVISYETIAPCIEEPLYTLLADYLPKRGRAIDPDKPMVALTFDDGPSKYTVPIAELAEQYDGRVTFCVVGNRIDQFSDSLIRVSEAGHEIANHTWEHKKLAILSYEEAKNQIQKTNDKVQELTGKPTTFIRPTYGSVSDTLRQLSTDLKMPLANWQVDTEDWKSRNADSVYQVCMAQVKDGDIILFHDLYESTYHAIERIIPELTAQGYQLVTLSELLEYSGQQPEYGHIYRTIS